MFSFKKAEVLWLINDFFYHLYYLSFATRYSKDKNISYQNLDIQKIIKTCPIYLKFSNLTNIGTVPKKMRLAKKVDNNKKSTILPNHGLVSLTKFHDDRVRNANFLLVPKF